MNKVSFCSVDYASASPELLGNLYGLRKEVFADRLNWKVHVHGEHEVDEYDNAFSTYLVGSFLNVPLASVRLINTVHPYMVEGPFRSFFTHALPKRGSVAESSRFFVDKTRSRALGLGRLPLTEMLLLAMHSHAARSGLDSVITVVSHAMSRIVRKAGWHYDVLDVGEASPGEKVLLLDMPITLENDRRLKEVIESKNGHPLHEVLELDCSPGVTSVST
ncbi:acyl-homoserine-lactone synthase [Pseudomonas syringae]|nr:acyl-homoserine-lactone synthase [Pseudomonas syringae]MCF5067848.1 acyl-homoserine-lactone synthase [Pseudomonas syringae]